MDAVELAKRKMAIQKQPEDVLRGHALWLLEQCWALSKGLSQPDNYRVEVWGHDRNSNLHWNVIAHGTRDYCLGWYDSASGNEYKQVVCGDFIVYPDEWYGLSAQDRPREKDGRCTSGP